MSPAPRRHTIPLGDKYLHRLVGAYTPHRDHAILLGYTEVIRGMDAASLTPG